MRRSACATKRVSGPVSQGASGIRLEERRVRGNGIEKSSLRRNKFDQIEAVRNAGLDAPLQKLARTASDVDAWLRRQVVTATTNGPLHTQSASLA